MAFIVTLVFWTPLWIFIFFVGTSAIGLNPFQLDIQNPIGEAVFGILYFAASVAGWVVGGHYIGKWLEKYEGEL